MNSEIDCKATPKCASSKLVVRDLKVLSLSNFQPEKTKEDGVRIRRRPILSLEIEHDYICFNIYNSKGF